jgi:hypothetical protein
MPGDRGEIDLQCLKLDERRAQLLSKSAVFALWRKQHAS